MSRSSWKNCQLWSRISASEQIPRYSETVSTSSPQHSQAVELTFSGSDWNSKSVELIFPAETELACINILQLVIYGPKFLIPKPVFEQLFRVKYSWTTVWEWDTPSHRFWSIFSQVSMLPFLALLFPGKNWNLRNTVGSYFPKPSLAYYRFENSSMYRYQSRARINTLVCHSSHRNLHQLTPMRFDIQVLFTCIHVRVPSLI